MLSALEQASLAFEKGEVPVGAVIVKDNKIVSVGHNRREEGRNALYHAEMEAIHEACRKLGTRRLEGCSIFVTLEPCPMCAGAILNARIGKVIFGAYDENYGCFGSATGFDIPKGFTRPAIVGGYMLEQCEELLKEFFSRLRK